MITFRRHFIGRDPHAACLYLPPEQWAVSAELSPLLIKVEKGTVSRIMPRPFHGAYLNVSGTQPKADPDQFQSISSNEGLILIQYTASGTVNTKLTASLGECPHLAIGGMLVLFELNLQNNIYLRRRAAEASHYIAK